MGLKQFLPIGCLHTETTTKETAVASHWVKVRGTIQPGIFPNERTVVITDHAGNKVVVVVPDTFVDERQNTVEVNLIDREGDLVLVSVPGELPDAQMLSVDDSELVA